MTPNAISIAANLIKGFEGFSSKKYVDGNRHAIGYGHNIRDNEINLRNIDYITPKQAESLLISDMNNVNSFLANRLKNQVTDEQYAALLSFGYNTGTKPLEKIVDSINAGNFSDAARTMSKYVYGRDNHGKMIYMDGLAERRKKELALFSNNINESVINNYYVKLKADAPADATAVSVPEPKPNSYIDNANKFIKSIAPIFKSGISYAVDIDSLLRGV